MSIRNEGAVEKITGGFRGRSVSNVWMVLDDETISLYQDSQKSVCTGTIELKTIKNVAIVRETDHTGFTVKTAFKIYTFASSSEQITQNWVEQIRSATDIRDDGTNEGRPKDIPQSESIALRKREMFGVKLRPTSSQRSSITSSTDSSSSVSNQPSMERSSINSAINSTRPQSVDVETDSQHQKRPPVPLPRSTSLSNKQLTKELVKDPTEEQNNSDNSNETSKASAPCIKRQTSVEKTGRPNIARKPPSYTPPPPPANVDTSTQTNKSYDVITGSSYHLDRNSNIETDRNATLVTHSLEDKVKDRNDNVILTTSTVYIEKKPTENGLSEERVRLPDQSLVGGSPVQMRRSLNRQTRIQTNEDNVTIFNQSPTNEGYHDVDISQVVMRRPSTNSRITSKVSDNNLEQYESDNEPADSDETKFDDSAFQSIFSVSEDNSQTNDIAISLSLNAYKTLKQYLEKRDRYFILDTHRQTMDNPVEELRKLLVAAR